MPDSILCSILPDAKHIFPEVEPLLELAGATYSTLNLQLAELTEFVTLKVYSFVCAEDSPVKESSPPV
jgi:hypothetical protein